MQSFINRRLLGLSNPGGKREGRLVSSPAVHRGAVNKTRGPTTSNNTNGYHYHDEKRASPDRSSVSAQSRRLDKSRAALIRRLRAESLLFGLLLTLAFGVTGYSLFYFLYGGLHHHKAIQHKTMTGQGQEVRRGVHAWDPNEPPLSSAILQSSSSKGEPGMTTENDSFPLSHKDLTLLSSPAGSYDYSISTTDAYGLSDGPFVGSFSHIRPLMDYTYHAHYMEERQRIQDRIILFFLQYHHSDDDKSLSPLPPSVPEGAAPLKLGECPPGYQRRGPWVVFTAGPMGAGKSHSLKWMARRGYFPLDKFVHVSDSNNGSTMAGPLVSINLWILILSLCTRVDGPTSRTLTL